MELYTLEVRVPEGEWRPARDEDEGLWWTDDKDLAVAELKWRRVDCPSHDWQLGLWQKVGVR